MATPSGGTMRSSTSSASASWGITSARTKLVTSSRLRPVRASWSMSRTFSSVGTTSGSFWKPSRGPTSRMRTRREAMWPVNLLRCRRELTRRPAGRRHGRRKARARDARRGGRRSRGDRQHRRRRRDPRRLRLARPGPRPVLAGRPHRRAGLGHPRGHVRGHGRAARARRGRLVQPRRPRPGGVPAAGAAARGGCAADRDARRAAGGAGRAGARAAAHRRAGPHARAGARPVVRLPGVHDPRARAGAGRGRRGARRGAGDAVARRRSRRSPRRARS